MLHLPKQIGEWLSSKGPTAGIGGLIVVVVWSLTSWRGENRLDYQYQLERFEARELKMEKIIDALQNQTIEQQLTIRFYEAAQKENPLAEWAKDLDGKYRFKNNAFDMLFVVPNGLDPDSVVGRTDLEIWPDKDLAKSYRNVDLQIIRERRSDHQTEYARIGDKVVPVHSWKYVIWNNHVPMGVGGIAVLEDVICN